MGGWWINAEKCDIYGPLRSQPRLAQTLGSGPWFVTRILSKGVKTERDKLAETEMEEQELWDDIGDVITIIPERRNNTVVCCGFRDWKHVMGERGVHITAEDPACLARSWNLLGSWR